MRNDTKLIETAAITNGDRLPADYCLARQLIWSGCNDQAQRIYRQILAETDSPTIRALVYNDLAALAATAGDTQKARHLLEGALNFDAGCEPARENWSTLGLDPPLGPRPNEARSPDRPIKLAIVSGLFNWPSSGGGNVHTVQLAMALRNAGCQVHHFFLVYEPWAIGRVEGHPIPSQPLTFSELDWTLDRVQRRVADAVREYSPDIVLLTDCWSLKPWLADAVSDFPYLLRFDAIECFCPLNNLRLIPRPDFVLEPCTKHRLATPEHCLKCVKEYSRFVGPLHKWEREFSRFDTKEYHDRLLQSLARADAVLVHNPLIAAVLEPYTLKVRVVPIGVDAETFGAIPALEANGEQNGEIKRIVFGGRTRDPIKGFQVLQAAGQKLRRTRHDFRIVCTGDPRKPAQPFISWQGWQSHVGMPTLLSEADIVAVPAVASEPFGLTVVEAMAAGRPVVASRVGGQQFTVIDGLTGLLCQPDNPDDLAEKLSRLLDSAALRIAIGAAGRQRFLSEYSWEVVIDRHYRPLLGLASRALERRIAI